MDNRVALVDYFNSPARGRAGNRLDLDPRQVPMIDAALAIDGADLDGGGFKAVGLEPQKTGAQGLAHAAAALVSRELGVSNCTAHVVRLPGSGDAVADAPPPRLVHAHRAAELLGTLPPEWLPDLAAGDFALVRMTIPGPAARGLGLAMIHAQTLDERHLKKVVVRHGDHRRRLLGATFSPAHVWFHFPQFPPHSALLRKVWDTRGDGRARWSVGCVLDQSAQQHGEVLVVARF